MMVPRGIRAHYDPKYYAAYVIGPGGHHLEAVAFHEHKEEVSHVPAVLKKMKRSIKSQITKGKKKIGRAAKSASIRVSKTAKAAKSKVAPSKGRPAKAAPKKAASKKAAPKKAAPRRTKRK